MRFELAKKNGNVGYQMKRKWLVIAVGILLLMAGLSYLMEFFPEENSEIRQEVRQVVANTFPEQAVVVASSFGLVMVGTPNHGSEFARFRVFSEFRDQWVNMTENGGHILRGFLDGAGEAKIDLLPQSRFLQALNSRPHPEGLRMLVIAGVVSPWDEKEVSGFLYSTLDNETATDTQAFIMSVSDGLGDGVVTVDSSRLQGVEHQTVAGTHLTMIRNMTRGSSNIPPAVPLIMAFLFPDG